MSLLRNVTDGLWSLFRKKQADSELNEELSGFLELAADEKIKQGMNRKDAIRAVRLERGNFEVTREAVRSATWESFVESCWQDLRYATRQLRANPLFTAAAILSLALGIGANTAIFQLIDAVRLRTLPVKNPQEIAKIAIDHRGSASGHFSSRYPDVTYAMWEQIRKQRQGFSEVFAWGPNVFNIAPGGEVHNVQGLWVSGEFFETLGVQPAVGRLLGPTDDEPACASPAVAISYSFWQRQYGGERSVVDRTLTINRQPFRIIGVTPPEFTGVEVGRYFDVAAPLCSEPLVNGEYSQLKKRSGWWLSVMGRLRTGWSIQRASAQLRTISPGLFEATLPPEFNPSNAKYFLQYKLGAFSADSGLSDLRKSYENPLWLLLGLAGLVLLIASANLANLMLARANTREREIGVRVALGAGRGRLIRQLLAESVLLAVIGAALGALLARNLSQVLVASLSTQHDPLFIDLGTDWRMFGFTAGLAVLTCILFGLAPALRAANVSPGVVLKESTRGTTAGRSRFGLRRILVVSQIALSFTLLVGALLFARSLNNLAGLDAGFRQNGILVTDIDFTPLNLPKDARTAFAENLLQRVRTIPGVESAALAAIVPLSGDGIGHDILWGQSGEPEGDAPVAAFNIVSPGYFDTLQTRILSGRDFDDHDTAGSPNVAIVNEEFAKQFAKGMNPVGMTFRVRTLQTTRLYEIIGLARNTKYSDLREDFQPIVYTAEAQYTTPSTDAQIIIHSRTGLVGLTSAIKNAAGTVNPNMNISFLTLRMTIEEGLLRDRLMARLSGFFAVLAVVLAVIGLYGVMSYMVTQRRNEIAIRMALGAEPASIIKLVMHESGTLLAAGLFIGVALALGGGQAATAMLFGLKPGDPLTLGTALFSLSLVAALASLLPARRASRNDPMTALRDE
ncbi:MAG TPA: ABC transporter permease [Candidatus Acidoferrum sp.]|nr:ABC transporter permease [Candidatus Acidoferrum sp.]